MIELFHNSLLITPIIMFVLFLIGFFKLIFWAAGEPGTKIQIIDKPKRRRPFERWPLDFAGPGGDV